MDLQLLTTIALIFLFGAASGCSWYVGWVSFALQHGAKRRRKFKRSQLAAAFFTSGFLAVGLLTLYFGSDLNDNQPQAIGYSCLVGLGGISLWRLSADRIRKVFGVESDG